MSGLQFNRFGKTAHVFPLNLVCLADSFDARSDGVAGGHGYDSIRQMLIDVIISSKEWQTPLVSRGGSHPTCRARPRYFIS